MESNHTQERDGRHNPKRALPRKLGNAGAMGAHMYKLRGLIPHPPGLGWKYASLATSCLVWNTPPYSGVPRDHRSKSDRTASLAGLNVAAGALITIHPYRSMVPCTLRGGVIQPTPRGCQVPSLVHGMVANGLTQSQGSICPWQTLAPRTGVDRRLTLTR